MKFYLYFVILSLFISNFSIAQQDYFRSEQLMFRAENPEMLAVSAGNSLVLAWNAQNRGKEIVKISHYRKEGESFKHLWTKVLPNSLDKLGGLATDDRDFYCLTVKKELVDNNPSITDYRKGVVRLMKIDGQGETIWVKEINQKTYMKHPTFSPLTGGTGCLAYGNGFITVVFAENTQWDHKINLRHQTSAFLTVRSSNGESVYPHEEMSWRHSHDQRLIFDGKDFIIADMGDGGFLGAPGISVRKVKVVNKAQVNPPNPMYIWSHGAYVYARQGGGVFEYTSLGDIAVGNNGYPLLFSSERNNTMIDESRNNWAEPVWEPRNLGFVHIVKDFETVQDGLEASGKKTVANLQRFSNGSMKINITENMVDTKKQNPNALNPYSFLSTYDKKKSVTQSGLIWLTNYTGKTNFISTERPKLIKIDNNKFLAIWEEWLFDKVKNPKPKYSSTKCMLIDEYGNILSPAKAINSRLNPSGVDQTFLINGKAAWVTGNQSQEEFYIHTLDESLKLKSYYLGARPQMKNSKISGSAIKNIKFNRRVQQGEELEKAFDDNENTIFHNDWGVKNNYPYIIEGDFIDIKSLRSFAYVARKGNANGRFLKGKLYKKINGEYIKIADFVFENSAGEKYFNFPKTNFEGFKIEITEAVGGFCSAMEIFFIEE